MLRQLYRSLSLLSWSGAPFRLGGAKIPCRWSCWSGVCRFNSRKALQDEVKKYQSEIYQRVVQKIEGDYHFKKYEVPMDCLKPCVVILRHDFAIEYIFDRKRPEVELLPDVAKSL